MGDSFLIVKLEGVLQSYGERAKWEYRDTAYTPTKSAVVGIIASAMGINRGDKRLIEISESLNMGVRVDRQGTILSDFQTVSGLHTTVENYKLGKMGTTASNKLAEKMYIEDGVFTVVLQGNNDVLEKYAEALKNPVNPVFLGRKGCVPTRPLFECITEEYEDVEDILINYPVTTDRGKEFLYCEIECADGEKRRYDETKALVAVDYSIRRVKGMYVKNNGECGVERVYK